MTRHVLMAVHVELADGDPLPRLELFETREGREQPRLTYLLSAIEVKRGVAGLREAGQLAGVALHRKLQEKQQ